MTDFTAQHYDYQVQDSDFFRAPANLFDTCSFCGLAILPGEVIAEWRDSEYVHDDCALTAMHSEEA